MTYFAHAITDTEQEGISGIPDYLCDEDLAALSREYDRIETGKPCWDNLWKRSDVVKKMAFAPRTLQLVKRIIGDAAIPVTAFFLNKTLDNNWQLPWHQNTKVAVNAFNETAGYTGWTNEAGVMHVIPPVEVLEHLVILRFNIDASDETNGGLQVLPRTHKEGILNHAELEHKVKTVTPVFCPSPAGSLTLLKALAVHQSQPSQSGKNRRILQVEYCSKRLHGNLKWYGL